MIWVELLSKCHKLFVFQSEYLSAKQEVDQLRQKQNRLRSERDVSIVYVFLLSVMYQKSIVPEIPI